MARIEKSRRYIQDALMILISKNNYDDISINDIVSKAGVSRMTFYRQFKDKSEIIKCIITEKTNEFIKSINPESSPREQIVKAFDNLIEGKDFAKKILDVGLYSLIKDSFDKIIGIPNNDYTSYFVSGGIANIYYYYLINDDEETAEELADMLLRVIDVEQYKKVIHFI